MSPIEYIVNQLGSALPAGSKLRTFAVELPDGSILTSTLVPAERAAAAPLAPSVECPATAANPASDEQPPEHSAHARETRRERVRRFRTKHGGDAYLKPREWAPITRLSEREIRRAMTSGALAWTEKGAGRDHLAKVVTADSMEAYLATVELVLRGEVTPPAWWSDVRG